MIALPMWYNTASSHKMSSKSSFKKLIQKIDTVLSCMQGALQVCIFRKVQLFHNYFAIK